MATKAATAVYAPGEDPESAKANLEYQEALKKLTESIDQRKNRFFDPTWLAAAQGFLAPGAPDFFESLGRVAGNVGKAQEAQAKENQDIAQMRLDLAGRGVELQRQKARDAMVRRELAGEEGPVGASPATPAGALPVAPGAPSGSAQGALAQARGAAPSQEMGYQFAPAVPGISRQKFFAMGVADGKNISDIAKEWEAIQRGRQQVKDNFMVDTGTGRAYALPTGQLEEVQIFSEDGVAKTYKVPRHIAAELSEYARNGDAEKYFDLAKRVTQGPQRKAPATAAAPQAAQAPQAAEPQAAAPAAPDAAAPRGLRSQEQIAAEKRQSEIDQAAATKRAEDLAKAAAAKEATLEDRDMSARRMFGGSTRILDYLKQSPNFYGIFARPGVVAAVGNLIKEGIQTPSGTLNLAGFEDSMRKLMPNVTQADLDNVSKVAAELAEIELNFSRTYFQGQGAVTEGERKIVRAIPGSVSSSPEVLRTRVELLKARAQYDIDVNDAFRQWQERNPGRSYLEFERKSDLYKEIKKGFEVETEKIFGGMRAVPTRERRAAPSGPQPSVGFIRDPNTGVIRRKKPGE
jgi:hypothetical protein